MKLFRMMIAAALAAATMTIPAVADENKVIMKVNGVEVTQADLDSAEAAFGASVASIPEKQRRLQLVRHLINTQLMASAAEAEKLDADPSMAHKKKYYARRALGDLYWMKKIRSSITEDDVKASYEDLKIEIHARHILLKTEEDAVDAIERLNRGEDFAELAKELSVGPSGKQGGDLGYFTKAQMVKAFADAAFKLKKGEITPEPVQTQFGWHVIKVEDIREAKLPPYDDVKGQILGTLAENKFNKALSGLLSKGKIEIIDEEIKKDLQEEAARGSFGGR